MAIRTIVTEGDSCLTKVCRPVTDFNDRLHMLLDDMRDTLEKAEGAGLAAPQVGILRRAALIMDGQGGYIELINPVITWEEGSQDGPEGCLSVPGRYGMVERPQQVTVRFQDRNGKDQEIHLEDFLASPETHEALKRQAAESAEQFSAQRFAQRVERIYQMQLARRTACCVQGVTA